MQITNQKYYSHYSVAANVTHSTTVQGVNFLLLLKKIITGYNIYATWCKICMCIFLN